MTRKRRPAAERYEQRKLARDPNILRYSAWRTEQINEVLSSGANRSTHGGCDSVTFDVEQVALDMYQNGVERAHQRAAAVRALRRDDSAG